MFVRYEDDSDEVATTVPCAFVARRAFGVPVIARLVVVALVVVEFWMETLPIVDEPYASNPVVNVNIEEVELLENRYAKFA